MRLAYAFLANAAEYTSDGKLWVLGGDIDTFTFDDFPATVPALSFVAKVLFEPAECGAAYRLGIDILRPDGESLNPSQIVYELRPEVRVEQPDRPVGAAMVLNIQGLSLPEPGDYRFVIRVDDEEMGLLPVRVLQRQAQ